MGEINSVLYMSEGYVGGNAPIMMAAQNKITDSDSPDFLPGYMAAAQEDMECAMNVEGEHTVSQPDAPVLEAGSQSRLVLQCRHCGVDWSLGQHTDGCDTCGGAALSRVRALCPTWTTLILWGSRIFAPHISVATSFISFRHAEFAAADVGRNGLATWPKHTAGARPSGMANAFCRPKSKKMRGTRECWQSFSQLTTT